MGIASNSSEDGILPGLSTRRVLVSVILGEPGQGLGSLAQAVRLAVFAEAAQNPGYLVEAVEMKFHLKRFGLEEVLESYTGPRPLVGLPQPDSTSPSTHPNLTRKVQARPEAFGASDLPYAEHQPLLPERPQVSPPDRQQWQTLPHL